MLAPPVSERDHAQGLATAAMTLLVVDVETGKTVAACAGSEPPLILRAVGGVEAVNSGRASLGVDPGQLKAGSTTMPAYWSLYDTKTLLKADWHL